jgi:hypothetical protein
MKQSNMYQRWQETILKEATKTRRVVLLAGARQTGKTTLAKAIASDKVIYRTLDDETLLQAAHNDPKAFVERDSKMLIIDEVQRTPELLPAIKMAVDNDNSKGQYLLTGSADIRSLPTVKESLAGRISIVRLRTLTQGEILGKKPSFLKTILKRSFPKAPISCSLTDILELAFRGGFPETIDLKKAARKEWHKDYIEALLTRDLKKLINIKRFAALQKLFKFLAAWSSKLMDLAQISSSLLLARPTVESYINALEMLYIVESLPAWSKTDYGRVGKKDKLFITDSGLMASILGWDLDEVRFNPDRLGKLFETFVFNELSSQIASSRDPSYSLFHYRDREQREIDFLIEAENEAMIGIEVKAASIVYPTYFKTLKWFEENMARKKPFTGIILYSGEHCIAFDNNMFAIPISFLWH